MNVETKIDNYCSCTVKVECYQLRILTSVLFDLFKEAPLKSNQKKFKVSFVT